MDHTEVPPLQSLASLDGAATSLNAKLSFNQIGTNSSHINDFKQPLTPSLDGFPVAEELTSDHSGLLAGSLHLSKYGHFNNTPVDSKVTYGDRLTGIDDLHPLVGDWNQSSLESNNIATPSDSQAIIFVDSGVKDYQKLLAETAPTAEVVVLNSEQDGIAQISAALAQRHNIGAVHILAHGGSGELKLGSTILTEGTLSQYASSIKGWSNALAANADLLIYACNVASGATGRAFVQELSNWTGADVAASDDLTGSAEVGGDWDLEVTTGHIEANSIFQGKTITDYSGVLAVFTGNQLLNAPASFNEDVIITGDTVLNVAGDFNLSSIGKILGDGVGEADNITIKASGAVTLGGLVGGGGLRNVTIEAQSIHVLSGATVSTRNVGSANPLLAGSISIGNSGVINFKAPDLKIDGGASLLANANNGFQAGDVVLRAEEDVNLQWELGTSLFFKNKQAKTSIDVGAATILGNNVSITTRASTAKVVNLTEDIAHDARAVVTGDVNGDGLQDLILGHNGASNRLFLNNGTAEPFKNVTGVEIGGSDPTSSLALGDVDGDGRLDLVVGNNGQTNRLFLNNGTGNPFSNAGITLGTAKNTTSVALGDVNGDGKLDLVVGNRDSASQVLLNTGTANPFSNPAINIGRTDAKTTAVALGDIDGDGDLDLVTGSDGTGDRLFLNDGTGNPFDGDGTIIGNSTDRTTAIALGDVNNDGTLDLVTGNNGQANKLFINTGTATPFNGPVTAIGSADDPTNALKLGDVNGDGRLDLIVGVDSKPGQYYLNNGTGNPFADVTATNITSDTGQIHSIALDDFNQDGKQDVVLGNGDELSRVYLNNATASPFNAVEGELLSPEIALVDRIDESAPVQLGLEGAVVRADADANIAIGSGAIITAANDVTLNSRAISNAQMTTAAAFLGVTYGSSTPTATVTVQGGINGAQITAGGQFDMEAQTGNILAVATYALSGGKASGSIGITYGKADSTSTADVQAGASITANSAKIVAQNANDFKTTASAFALEASGPLGISATTVIGDYTSSANATVNGTVNTAADAVVDAKSINTNNDTRSSATILNKLQNKAADLGSTLQGINTAFTKRIGGFLFKAKSDEGLGVAVSAAVAVVDSHNTADAHVGESGRVNAGGNVSITAKAEDNFQSSAVSSAGDGDKGSVGGSVAYTDYTNQADAYIAPNATVNAGQALNVQADARIPNQVDFFGAELDLPGGNTSDNEQTTDEVGKAYSNGEAITTQISDFLLNKLVPYMSATLGVENKVATTFTKSGGTVRKDGKVGIAGNINILGVTNTANAYIGEGARINQDFATLPPGQSVNVNAIARIETVNFSEQVPLLPLPNPFGATGGAGVGGSFNSITYNNGAKAHIDDRALVRTSGDVNVKTDTFNYLLSVTQSGALAEKLGIDGAVTYSDITNESIAYIEDGAIVSAGGNANVVANHQLIEINGTGGIAVGGKAGVGVSGSVNIVNNTTHAFIGNLNNSTAPHGSVTVGGNLNVNATSTQDAWSFSVAGSVALGTDNGNYEVLDFGDSFLFAKKGGKEFGFAVSGDAAFNFITDNTQAFIQNAGPVNVNGQASVKATNNSFLVGGAGAIAAANNTGVGGSYAHNQLNKTTLAFTENVSLTAGSLKLDATSDNRIFGGTAGGSGAKEKASVAGSANLNLLTNNTQAYLGSGTTATTTTGGAEIKAKNTGLVWSVAGAVSVTTGGKASVGAALDLGLTDTTVKAFIDSTARLIAAGDILLSAIADETINSIGASLSAAVQDGVGASGSGAVQVVKHDVQAYVANGSTVTTPNSLYINANDNTNLLVIAGSAAGGKEAGVGLAVADANVVDRKVKAFIGDNATVSAGGFGAGITDPDGSGLSSNGITIDATTSDRNLIFSAGVGASKGQAGVAASGVFNTMSGTTEAYIGQGARVNTDGSNAASTQSVQLRANHKSDILSAAGGFGGAKEVGAGAAADVQVINKTVKAYISSSAQVNAQNNVTLDADSQNRMLNIAAGIGIGVSTAGLAGSASVLTLNNTTQAYVDDSATVTAEGNVSIAADDTLKRLSIAGAGGFGNTAGIGVSNTTLVKTGKTEAYVGKLANVTAKANQGAIAALTGDRDADGNLITGTVKGVSVTATAKQDIIAVTAGAAAGTGVAGVAGSAAVNVLNETTRAFVDEGATINDANANAGANQSVNLLAVNDTDVKSSAGGVAFGSSAGVGAGADVGVINKTTEAYMAAGASANATGDVKIQALSNEDVISVSGSAGLSGEVGVAGAAGVYTLQDTTNAYIGNNARIAADGSVVVAADDQTDLNVIAGSVAVGVGTASFGASAGVPVIIKETNSYIGDGAIVDAKGRGDGVTTRTGDYSESFVDEPDGEGHVKAPVVKDSNVKDPNINKQRVATANTQTVTGVAVTATSQNDVEIFAAGGGGSAFGSVQLAGAVNVLNNTTTASIGNNAKINTNTPDAAIGQSVVVAAGSDYSHLGVAGGATLSTVAVTPGADVAIAKNTTQATIGQGAQVNAVKDVQVSAEASESLLSISASVGAGAAVGIAGAASVVSLNNTTEASIANDAIVNAGGNVLVNADDTTESDVVAGSLGVGLLGAGDGGSVVVGLITKDTSATVGDRAQINAKGNGDTAITAYTGATNLDGSAATEARHGLVVQAHSSEDLFGVTAVGSGGTYAGFSGAVSVNIVDSDTNAEIGDGAVINGSNTGASLNQDVSVVAVNEAKINSVSGSATGSIGGSIAGGVDVGIVRNDTTAVIGDGATVNAQQDVDVNALATKSIDSFTISGSGGAVALAAAVTVYAIGGNLDSASRDSLTQGGGTAGSYVNNQVGAVAGQPESVDDPTKETGVLRLLQDYSDEDRDGEDNTLLVHQYTSDAKTSAKTSIKNSSITNQVGNAITTNTPVPSGTSATISGGARVNAGRDVDVEAQDQLDLDITAGGGGIGVGSVGGSVAIANIDGNTTATIAEGAIVNAALVDSTGDVTVKANLEKSTLKGKAYGGSGGVVALGAQVAILNDNSDQTAEVKTGATIGQANAVTIEANADRTVDAQSLGGSASLGGLAAGASIAHATIGGSTQATTGADVTIRQVNAIDVNATSNLDTNAKAVAVAVGTGFASGAGADSKASISGQVNATVGDRNTLQTEGHINVQSDAQTKAKAESLGIAVSASFDPSLSVGVSLAEATITPSINASVGQSSTLTAGQTINVEATHTQKTDGTPQAKANASGGGTLVGVNGSDAKVTIAPTVTATVNTGASLTSVGTVNLHATSTGEEARAVATGITVSLGGAGGASLSEANIGGTPEAKLDGANPDALLILAQKRKIGGTTEAKLDGATVNSANLSVMAQSSSTAKADAQADAGGLLGAGTGSSAKVTVDPTTRATITSNSNVTATQSVEVKATNTTSAETNAEGISVGGAAQIGVSLADTTVKPTVEALVGSNTSITAGQDVTVQGSHTNTQTKAAASASGGSGVLSGNGAEANSTLTATVKGNVSTGVAIAAGRDVAIGAVSTGSATSTADGFAVGGLAGVGATIANAKADGSTESRMDGLVTDADNLTVIAQSDQTSSATTESTSGGAVSVRGSKADANTATITTAHIGDAAKVTVTGDFKLNAISSTDADANAKGKGGGVGDVGSSTATATMNPTLGATVGQGASITAGGDIQIEAKQGKAAAISDGTFNPSTLNRDNDSITLNGNHGLNTGDQITYSKGDSANQPVSGLVDGRSYNVIRVDDKTVRLGNTFDTSQITNDQDTIQFFGPTDPETGGRIQRSHNFQTGDRVIYHTNGNPITGLQDSGIYYVRRIDASTIKLANSLAEATAPLVGFGKGQVDSGKNELNFGGNPFANGQAVTYRAPAASRFSAGQVNVDSNTIELVNQAHGYVTGQKVVYSSQGDAIGNLGQNREYFVIRVDDSRFKLADSKKNAEDGKAIDLTSGGSGEQSVRPLSIRGLVDGQTYYVLNGEKTFQLANVRGGGAIDIDASEITGTHFIGVEGIDLDNTNASGDHRLQLDIDNTSATGSNHRLIGAGGALALAVPSTADGIATATSSGSSGKLVGKEGTSSTVNASTTVSTLVEKDATLTAGGNVTVLSDSTNNAGATARNRQGSFIASGPSSANATVNNINKLVTGDGVIINAGGSVDLKSVSSQQGTTYADSQGKGVVPLANSTTTTTVYYTTQTTVGQNNQITAKDNVLINAVSSNDGSSSTYASAKGLGNDSNAIATVNSNGSTQTEISSNANLKAAVISLDAHASNLKTDVSANSYGAGLGATTKAETNSTAVDQTNLIVRSGASLSGSEQVNLLSQQDKVNTISRAYGELDAFGGDTDVFANNTQNTNASVLTEAGSKIKTGLLNVEADTESRLHDTSAEQDGAFIDGGDRSENPSFTTNRSINFNSTLSAEVDPELVIDANGNVIRAYNAGIQDTDNTVLGPVQAADVVVNDLQNNTEMQVNFTIPDRGYGQAGALTGNPVFQRSYDRVDIINRSDKDLVVNEINVINPKNPVYIKNVQDQSSFVPGANVLSSTVVNVQNQNTGDVVLNGKIYNPHAETDIHNTGGDILSRGSNALIETRDLDITSDQGGIGTSDDRVKARIVQGFEGDTNRDTALTAIANKGLYMNLQGVVQDGDNLVINANNVVSTTDDVNLKLDQAVNQANAGVPSTYQFNNLRAGGNIIIDAASNDINVIGNIDIVNDGKLDVVTGGDVNLTESTGKLDVKRVISSNGNVQLTVKDAPNGGQDLILNSDAVVSAAQGAVTLLAGDDVKMAMGATLTAGTTATVQGDAGDADSGTGSEIALRGAVNTPQLVITGSSDADTVSLREATGYTQSAVDLGAGNDRFDGGAGRDVVTAGSGDDSLNGNGGDDSLSGGDGKDSILGGAGNDQIDGGAGDDTVQGGAGDDSIVGGDGKDNLSGEAGRDRIDGGTGDDAIQGGDDNDLLFGGDGNDTMDGQAGDDELHGGSGTDLVKGSTGNDALFGDADNDDLEGGTGNDAISGGAGDDSLFGDRGNDQLQGDAGDDYLEGGADADIFAAIEDGDILADFGDGPDSLT